MHKKPMTKEEIKTGLRVKGVRPIDIAQKANKSRSMVSHVMAGRFPGSPIRNVIARAMQKKKSEIWPPSC